MVFTQYKRVKEMYVNKVLLEVVSGFDAFSNYYWSSTEYDKDSAWTQEFLDGYQDYYSKD
jgi:hypothetical protein